TNINSTLAQELKRRTTCPPLILANNFTVDTVLFPQAQRDNNIPDLGYSYAPLDYIISGLTASNAVVTLTNGVAVGVHDTTGLTLMSGSKLVSGGAADNLNLLGPIYMVQEAATNWGSALLNVLKLPGSAMTAYP